MAWYDTGTVSVTNGSTTVTGSGTNFIAGAQIGEAFYGPDDNLYEIQAIVSATEITLADLYLGATQTGQAYKIVPTQSLVADLTTQVSSLISDFQSVKDEAGEGKFDDGTAASAGITFNLDQDTGFFRPAANQIGFTAAGVQRALLTSTGLDVTGDVTLGDNDKAIFGAGSDLQIYHSTHSYIEDAGGGDLILKASDQIKLQNGSGQNMAIFNENGAVVLTHSEATKLATSSTGIDVTGTVKSTVSTTGDNNFQAISTGGGQYRIYPDDATTANPTWLHQSNSSEEQAWVIGGVERMRIDSSGHAIIPAGVTLGTAAGVYNADKTLDDYEEGTWTPVISDGTNDATPNIAVGTYTKVGNLVHVQGRIVLSSLGSVSGAVQLKGLPFNSKALSNNFGVLVVGRASLLNRPAGLKVSGDLRSNVDYVNLILNDTNSGTSNMQSTEFTDDGDIAFSMQYITA